MRIAIGDERTEVVGYKLAGGRWIPIERRVREVVYVAEKGRAGERGDAEELSDIQRGEVGIPKAKAERKESEASGEVLDTTAYFCERVCEAIEEPMRRALGEVGEVPAREEEKSGGEEVSAGAIEGEVRVELEAPKKKRRGGGRRKKRSAEENMPIEGSEVQVSGIQRRESESQAEAVQG